MNERAVGPRLVAEPQRRRIATVDKDDTFQPTGRGRQFRPQLGRTGDCLRPASDLHGPPRYRTDQPLPGRLAYGTGLRKRDPCACGQRPGWRPPVGASSIAPGAATSISTSVLSSPVPGSAPSGVAARRSACRSCRKWPCGNVSIFSSTAGSLMMMPRRAASDTAPMIATGMAIKSGQGVATTSTARNRVGSRLACPGDQRDGYGQRACKWRPAGRRAAANAGGPVPRHASPA